MDKAVKKKIAEYIVITGLSFLTMIAMAQVSGYGITGIELLLPCIFALCVIVFSKTKSLVFNGKNDFAKKDLKFTIPLGAIASLCAVVGSKIDLDSRSFDSFGIKDIAFIVLLIPFFVSVFSLLFFSSDALTISVSDKGVEYGKTSKTLRRFTIVNAGTLLICWLPYYLTYYPGGIGNDIFEIVRMCKGNIPLTNHHPIAFTGIVKLFMVLCGDETLALGMMVLVQMIAVAFTLSLVVTWLKYSHINKWICGISIAFFALHPIVAMYSIYLTKDVIFACVVVLLVLFLFDYCKAAKAGEIGERIVKLHIVLGLLCFLTIITRNNGTLVVIISMIAVLIFTPKTRKAVLITLLAVLILLGIYKGPVWKMLGVEKQSFAESAAIPLTQIAYTIYTDGEIEGEEKAYLEELMPFGEVKANFFPGYVDTYKFDKSFNAKLLDESPARFMKVWLALLPENFGRYVEGYLFETCGYWHYGVTNTVATEGVVDNDLGIIGTDYTEAILGVSVRGLLAQFVLVARKLPVLCLLSQMAIEILAVVLLVCQLLRRKMGYLIPAIIPLVAIWISVMIASPAYCLFRYMCPVFFLWPMILVQFYKHNK